MAKKKQGDGSVFQRRDGRWEGRIVVGYKENGYAQTKNVTAHTKTECQEKLAKLREECGRRSEKIKPDMPFGDWIDFWYQNYSAPKLRPTTQACYSGIYAHHPVCRQHPAEQADAERPATVLRTAQKERTEKACR